MNRSIRKLIGLFHLLRTKAAGDINHCKMERIKLMFHNLFGSQGTFMQMLNLIAKQRIDRRGEVLDFCQNNQLLDADGIPDHAGIARFIDWTWQSVPAKHGKNSNLTGTAQTQAMNRMTTCMDICAQWLDLTEENLLQDTEDAAKQCNQLTSYFIKAQDELMVQKPSETYTLAAWAVLNQTLTDLENALQGRPRNWEDYFIKFLYTGYIELDGDFHPVPEPLEYMISGYEPWERLLCHDEAMMMSALDWDASVTRILRLGETGLPQLRLRPVDLRHCQKLNLTVPLRLDEARLEDDDRRTLTQVNEIEDRYQAKLELAATYGQIEDNTHKERLVTAVTKQQREPRYRNEFDQIKQTTPPCPIFNAALAAVYKCLCQNGLLDKTSQPKNWEELFDRIQARMDKSEDRIDRFLLLLDEADRFLETSSALNYRPVECLYQLETAMNDRFKFVLAGLHSVMRFSRNGTKGNSVLSKLSSLTIKPLNFQEASQLRTCFYPRSCSVPTTTPV